MIDIDFFKKLEGENVWLLPRGNRVNRHNPKDYEFAVLEKVKFEMAVLRYGERLRSLTLRMNEGHRLDDEFNGGYLVFQTEKQLLEYFKSNDLVAEILRKYPVHADWQKIEYSKIKQIAEILGIEIDHASN